MKDFADIIRHAQAVGPKRLAVAGAPDEALAEAIAVAADKGIATAAVFDTADDAVAAVTSARADVLMKGSVDTKAFMRAILDKDAGMRTGKLISHVTVLEGLGRLRLITDGGICISPTKDEKIAIIENVLPIAHALGYEIPRVALLAAVEKVDPKMPETMDAVAISEAGISGCHVQGPLAVDNAVDPRAAEIKGISGPVAGQADVLVVPSVAAGNMFAKGIMYFTKCKSGGLVAGASHPVVFLSRSDPAETKFNTIALGVLCAGFQD